MKILFFAPHMYYNVHALPEALVAESLQHKGAEIIYLGCDGILSNYCLCMSSINSNTEISQKLKICEICKKNRNAIYSEFKINSIFIEDFISEVEVNNLNYLLSKIEVNNIINFKYLNYEIGKYSLYEFLLNRKLNTLIFNKDEFEELKMYIKNSLITLVSGIKIFNKYNFDRVVTYNSLYSVNHVVCAIAESNSIPHFTLHAGSHNKYRLSEMTIFKGLTSSILINIHKKWHEFYNYSLAKNSIIRAHKHILALLTAKSPWVYSIKSNKYPENLLKEKFGITSNQKILLATMASADERFAADIIGALPKYKEPFFRTQIEWVEFLINLAKNDKNIFVIIRVHPREFPNKREKVLSKQAIALQNMFIDIPENCYINFPKDNISLHDIIKITDVGLNSTSTACIELLLFGIPVVLYDSAQLFSYGREMNIIADDQEDYLNKIYKAIESGPNLNNIISVFRWVAYKSEIVSIDISDGYKIKVENFISRQISKAYNFLRITNILKPVSKRIIPLKNIENLTYAILNNEESHIDSVEIKKYNNKYQEVNLIKKYIKIYSSKISTNKDINFLTKMNKIINS